MLQLLETKRKCNAFQDCDNINKLRIMMHTQLRLDDSLLNVKDYPGGMNEARLNFYILIESKEKKLCLGLVYRSIHV